MSSPAIDPELLSLLACPQCKGRLTVAKGEEGLLCGACRLLYPVRDGIPVMLPGEARPLPSSQTGSGGERAAFLIVEGKNQGGRFEIETGNCVAIGRSLDDKEKTRTVSVDAAATLDDASKKLVIQYVSRQFQGQGKDHPKTGGSGEAIGSFVRRPDFRIRDTAVSRLHAMIFYDASGAIGILDLVSKNGTFVNGTEVESKILKKGDLISMGGTKIRFET